MSNVKNDMSKIKIKIPEVTWPDMTMWSGMVLSGSSMMAASDPLNLDFDFGLQTQTKLATRPPDENSSVSMLRNLKRWKTFKTDELLNGWKQMETLHLINY